VLESTVILAALCDRAPLPSSDLARTLAAASRAPGHRRIQLGPLDVADVAELVHRETGRMPDAGAARSIHSRTAGNPFFIQELSRLLANGLLTQDIVARAEVPSSGHPGQDDQRRPPRFHPVLTRLVAATIAGP
jgi:hypothetical protein